MITGRFQPLALLFLMALLPAAVHAQDVQGVLSSASKAMGADKLKSITYSATGSIYDVAVTPGTPWPHSQIKVYTRDLNFDVPSSRIHMVRISDLDHQEQVVNLESTITAGSPWAQQLNFWLTPFGFLEAARLGNPALELRTIDGAAVQVVTASIEGKHRITGFINSQTHVVERVVTTVDDPVRGPLEVEGTYRDYKDFGRVKFPETIFEKQNGSVTSILIVNAVEARSAGNPG